MADNRVDIVIGAKDKASREFTNVSKKLQDMANKINKVSRQMMMWGAGGTAAIMGLVKATVDYGESVDKVAKQTGLTREEVQKLEYAATQEHASFETLARGMPVLSKYMDYASMGMETYKRVFDKMGISVVDNEGKLRSVHDVLMDMADYMASDAANDTEKLSIVMQLLGRRGAELLPFLKLGREGIMRLEKQAEKLGGVMSEEDVKASKKFKDTLYELIYSVKGIVREIGVSLIPILTGWIEKGKQITKWFRELSPETKNFIAKLALFAPIGLTFAGVLLFISGHILGLVANLAILVEKVGLLGSQGAVSIGALTTSFGYLTAAIGGAFAAFMLFQEVVGFINSLRTGRAAANLGKEIDEIRKKFLAGEITKEEAKRQMELARAKYGEGISRAYSEKFATTSLERFGKVISEFQKSLTPKLTPAGVNVKAGNVPFGKQANINMVYYGDGRVGKSVDDVLGRLGWI